MASARKSRQSKSGAKKSKKRSVKKKKAAVAQTPTLAPAAGENVKVAGRALAPERPKSEAELCSLIEGIGAPSLHDEDIATALKHLNSVATFRAAVARRGRTPKAALRGKCYLKSAGDPIVSIYEGPYHVDSMSEDSAIALGIPRCGA